MDIESNRSEMINERGERIIVNNPPVDGGAYVAETPTAYVAEQPAVYVTEAPAVAATRSVSSYGSVALYAIVAGIVAIVLLILGGITVARAGLDGPLDDPVTNVAGFTSTALLGLIELGFGVVLLIAALSRAREVILFLGIIGSVAAIIGIFQPDIGNGALAMEKGFAVLMTVLMIAVALSAFLPTFRHTSNRIERV